MLLRSLSLALLAVVGVVQAQSFSSLSSCGQSCINSMDTTTGCVPVTSECLCSNVNFLYGIADCANKACSSADAGAAVSYAKASCSSVLASTSTAPASTSETPATSETATSTAKTSATEATSTSEDHAQAASSTSTPLVAGAVATTSSEGSASTATAASSDSTATAASETSDSTGTATAAGASSTSDGTSSSSASESSSSSDSSTAPAAPGLSTGAKAGIVVSCAAAAVGMVALVMILSRRRSRPLPRGTLKISEPLPGSGRIGDEVWEQYHQQPFTPPPPRTAGSKMTELDRHARPYDEMVPRMTPTRMV